MRTPKIKALHDLIDWMKVSEYSNTFIPKLPLSSEPLTSNPWFAGFIDGDGHFTDSFSFASVACKRKRKEATDVLVQRLNESIQ